MGPGGSVTDLCLCSHLQGFHEKDAKGNRTRECYMPLCGCNRFRKDPRPVPAENAATGGEAA